MTHSKRQLYALGEPFGSSATRTKPGGRIYGGGGSNGGSSQTTQSIPDELKPLASAYTNKAIGLSNQQFNPYQGQRNADLNTTQNLGIGMVQNRALNGDATVNAGSQFLQNTMNAGKQGATANPYAGPNPYLDAMVNKSQQAVANNFNTMTKPQTETAMANSGSFGNSGLTEQLQNQQKAAVTQMADISNSMYGNAYNTQAQMGESFAARNDAARQNQTQNGMGAAQLGLQYGNQAYTDAAQLGKAGQVQQDQNQNNLDFNYNQYQDASNLPYKQLSAMSGVFGSNLGGSSSTTQTGGGGK